MSIGFYRHPTLGESRKYIFNNKNVLQIKTDTNQTQSWSRQFTTFKEQFLGNKQQDVFALSLKFYLLPEQMYVDREAVDDNQSNTKAKQTRVIIYEHFIVTLKEQLQMRIKYKDYFTINELWFFLYALASGALEMIQVHDFSTSQEDIEINPQSILLNEYGFIKLMGYFSTPFTARSRGLTPEFALTPNTLPHRLQICCSSTLARILTSMILLKELDEYIDPKIKLFSDQKLLEELKSCQQRLGILYNIIRLMLADNYEDRLIISEIKAMLLPYEEQIMSLKDFTIDQETSHESMTNLLIKE